MGNTDRITGYGTDNLKVDADAWISDIIRFCAYCGGRGKRHIFDGYNIIHEDCKECKGKGYFIK